MDLALGMYIPRMLLCANQADRKCIPLNRLLIPVRPAFAMTINKSQGQRLQKIGLYLPQPTFTHGQLYVASSRYFCRSEMKVMIVGGRLDVFQGCRTSCGYVQQACIPAGPSLLAV